MRKDTKYQYYDLKEGASLQSLLSIRRIIREYYEKFYMNKFDNLSETDKLQKTTDPTRISKCK